MVITDNPAYPEETTRSLSAASTPSLGPAPTRSHSTVFVNSTPGGSNADAFLQQLANAGPRVRRSPFLVKPVDKIPETVLCDPVESAFLAVLHHMRHGISQMTYRSML